MALSFRSSSLSKAFAFISEATKGVKRLGALLCALRLATD